MAATMPLVAFPTAAESRVILRALRLNARPTQGPANVAAVAQAGGAVAVMSAARVLIAGSLQPKHEVGIAREGLNVNTVCRLMAARLVEVLKVNAARAAGQTMSA
jgi:hypothetical protein